MRSGDRPIDIERDAEHALYLASTAVTPVARGQLRARARELFARAARAQAETDRATTEQKEPKP